MRIRPVALRALVMGASWLLVVACARDADDSRAVRPTIEIAANLPLSGDLATYGSSIQEGATMALRELAQDSQIALSIDWQDNAGSPATAVTILQRQLLQDPDIYVSGVKPQTMAIGEQVARTGMPHFVWIFDPVINRGSANNMRTWVSYKIEPPVYLRYAQERGARRVAIVYVRLPHTVEEFDSLVVPGLRSQGVSDLLVEPFEFGKSDFKDIAVKLQQFRPDLIILNGFQTELVGLVRALRPYGLIRDGNVIATYDMLDAAKVLGPDELEGIRVVAPLFVSRPDRPEVAQWRARFRAQYRKEPLYTHAFAYDMVRVIADAGRRLQLPASSDQWLHALRQTDTQGVTGRLAFDSDGDLLTPLEVGVFRRGTVVPDTSQVNP